MGGEDKSRPARRFAHNAGQLLRLHTEAIRETHGLVALLPLILFAFCVTGGVVAVRFAALSYANSQIEVATALLASVTTVRARPRPLFLLSVRACASRGRLAHSPA